MPDREPGPLGKLLGDLFDKLPEPVQLAIIVGGIALIAMAVGIWLIYEVLWG